MAEERLFKTPLKKEPEEGRLFRTPITKPQTVSRSTFNRLALPLLSGAQPISMGQVRFPTQEERLKQIDAQAKTDLNIKPKAGAELRAPTFREKVNSRLAQATPPLLQELARDFAEAGLSAGEAIPRLLSEKARQTESPERTVPGLSFLGPVQSHWSKAVKRTREGDSPEMAALKSVGEFAIDEPFALALKPIFLGAGLIIRKLSGNADNLLEFVAKSNSEDDIARNLRDFGFNDDFSRSVAPDLVKITNPEQVATKIDDALRDTYKITRAVSETATPARGVIDSVPLKRTATVAPRVAGQVAPEATAGARVATQLDETPVISKDVLDNIRLAQQDNRPLARETMEYLARSRVGTKELKLPEGDTVTLWRTGELQPGAVQSYSLTKQFKSQQPVVVNKSDILADLGSQELRDMFSKTYVGKMKQQALKSLDEWTSFENEILVRTSPDARVATPKDVSAMTASRATPSGSPIERAKSTYAEGAVARQPKVEARSKEGLTRLTGELLTPISSRLERINPELKKALRRFESNVAQNTRKDTQQILPFLKSFSKMSKEDWAVLDLAMKNGDVATIDALAKQYDFAEEVALVRQTLDDLHMRAKEAGMEVNYRENYFPRIVNDPKALIKYLLGSGEFTATDELIDMLAKAKGKKYTDLTDEEIASLLNTQVRGYGEPIGLTAPKFTKQRTVREIDTDMNRFYVDSDEALATYIVRMNDEIEARKFFGKGDNIDESIGSYIIKEVNAGRLNPMDIPEVSSILKSRFARGKMNGALEVYRNAEYISTMGSPTSAITQIGDLAFGAYKNGVYHHLKGMAKTISRTGVTKEQLGIERITEEFTSRTKSAQALDFVFKATGLTVLDRLGKESLINGTFSKLRTMAKNGDPKLYDELYRSLNADEIPQAIEDLKAGKLTNLTEVALFNRLLDFQPVAKSEMPEMYLRHPNGRIFYMLKSFTLKQIDIFRRESLDLITSGEPKKVAQGMGNLVRLAGMFMLANMGADAIKDAVTGRETDISDTVIDNMWRLVGASKYDVYKAKTEGAGKTVIGKILFPTSLWDRAYQDVSNIATGKEYKTGPLKGEQYKSELIQSVPLGGKLYYWWFGRGAQKEMYNNVSTDSEGNLKLPKAPELPKLPSLPKL